MQVKFPLAAVAVALVIGAAAANPKDYLKKPDAWFAQDEAKKIAANILSFQSDLGGWPKNENTTAKPYMGDRKDLKPTYDNGVTTDELRFLARIYTATKDEKYRTAFERGLDYVLKGQYPNGGWPQLYPPGKAYHRHITFNDDAMVRLLIFVREVASTKGSSFLDADRRKKASDAFDRGIACILKCQIKVKDKLTAWCAQHDEIDFRPQPDQSFELASVSGARLPECCHHHDSVWRRYGYDRGDRRRDLRQRSGTNRNPEGMAGWALGMAAIGGMDGTSR